MIGGVFIDGGNDSVIEKFTKRYQDMRHKKFRAFARNIIQGPHSFTALYLGENLVAVVAHRPVVSRRDPGPQRGNQPGRWYDFDSYSVVGCQVAEVPCGVVYCEMNAPDPDFKRTVHFSRCSPRHLHPQTAPLSQHSLAYIRLRARPPNRPPLRIGAWFSFLPLPEPLFLPPPLILLTVAHARRLASRDPRPRDS